VEGVESASVDLASESAHVVGTASLESLVAAIEALGKTAALQEAAAAAALEQPAQATTIKLHIGGMTCNGCRGRAEKALQAVEGVESASVDLASESAHVVGTASLESLVAAIEALGKTAALLTTPSGTPPHQLAAAAQEQGTQRVRLPPTVSERELESLKQRLEAMEGVDKIIVSFERLTVEVQGTMSLSTLMSTCKEATISVTPLYCLHIAGLSAAKDVARVEQVLLAVEGVRNVTVDEPSASVLIDVPVDPQPGVSTLVLAINQLDGLTASLAGLDPGRPRIASVGGKSMVHRFHVQHIGCESCGGKLNAILVKVPGFTQLDLNVKTSIATITASTPPQLLQDAAALGGFPMTPEGVSVEAPRKPAAVERGAALETFSVTGMTCASCVGRVEQRLKNVAGGTATL